MDARRRLVHRDQLRASGRTLAAAMARIGSRHRRDALVRRRRYRAVHRLVRRQAVVEHPRCSPAPLPISRPSSRVAVRTSHPCPPEIVPLRGQLRAPLRTPSKARTYVPVIGFKNFAPRTPDLLNGGPLRFAWINEASMWPFHLPNAAAVYQHGGGPFVPPRIMAACRFLDRPIIKHWLGSDVMRANDPLVQAQNATGQIVHWANSPWLAAELAQAGITAQTVSNLGTDGTMLPIPPGPLTVLAFLPSFEFYGGRDVLALARALPDVRFLVVANDGRHLPHEPNVEYLGYRDDMRAVYDRCHLLLRMPEHDGKSRMVCEALAYGRHVIWNYPFVGSRLATSRPL